MWYDLVRLILLINCKYDLLCRFENIGGSFNVNAATMCNEHSPSLECAVQIIPSGRFKMNSSK